MMERAKQGFLDVPTAWGPLLGRTGITALAGFIALQAKEYFDAGRFDTPATAVDAVIVAGAAFVVYALLRWGRV